MQGCTGVRGAGAGSMGLWGVIILFPVSHNVDNICFIFVLCKIYFIIKPQDQAGGSFGQLATV